MEKIDIQADHSYKGNVWKHTENKSIPVSHNIRTFRTVDGRDDDDCFLPLLLLAAWQVCVIHDRLIECSRVDCLYADPRVRPVLEADMGNQHSLVCRSGRGYNSHL